MRHCNTLVLMTAIGALVFALPTLSYGQTVHAGLGYNSHQEDPGVLVGGTLPAGPVQVGGDFTWLLTDDGGGDSYNAFTIDVNGRLPVLQTPGGPTVSVTGGLNVFRWSWKGFGETESNTDIGPAAGARVDFPVGPVSIFGQGQVVFASDSDGFTFGGGLSLAP